MFHRHALVGLALIGALTALPACASKKQTSSSSLASSEVSSSEAEEGFYKEEYKDGRFYVFGQESTYEAWKQNGHMPYTRTQIGGGPGGMTVVYEIDKTDPALTDWLEREYTSQRRTSAASHDGPASSFYAELMKDGRYYVFGTPQTEKAFRATGHMPYTRTFVGAAPGGKTVVLEVDKDDDGLANRLEAEFDRRHGLRR